MRRILMLLLCLTLTGCATVTSRAGYTSKSTKLENVRELTDEQFVEIFNNVYDAPVEEEADKVAKSIAIDELIKAAKKRHSKIIKASGILKLKYKKIWLYKWSDKELVGAYRSLKSEIGERKAESASWLLDRENALTIIRATAMVSIAKEIIRRDSIAGGWGVFGTAVSVSAFVAMELAAQVARVLLFL
ncbi:MAG: hypothetical protein ACE5JK_00390 [Candidatus Omnitrophota bacterium]